MSVEREKERLLNYNYKIFRIKKNIDYYNEKKFLKKKKKAEN